MSRFSRAPRIAASSIVLVASLAAVPADAQQVSRIVAIGDSWTDDCCSNGPPWVEHVADELGVPLTNLAHGGDTSGELLEQARDYLDGGNADADALYVYWNVGNDFTASGGLDDIETTVAQIAANMSTTLIELSDAGATRFLVFNNLDGALVPRAINQGLEQLGTFISTLQNQATDDVLSDLDMEDSLFDAHAMFNEIVGDPRFTNTRQACEDVNCNNPNQFVWWDDNHPTAETHRIIAARVVERIESATPAAPNPPSALTVQ